VISRRSLLKRGLLGLAGSQLPAWPATADARGGARSERASNCLLVVLDSAAARHFGSWGYARDTTPNLDALAHDGFAFRNAYSQASATIPSVRSYFTSRRPDEKRMYLLASEFTIADAFRREGFRTGLFSENPYITPAFGYDKGFDSARVYYSIDDLREAKKKQVDFKLESEKLHADVRDWISTARSTAWFCCIHHLRPHGPYLSPEPFASRFAGRSYRGRADGSTRSLHAAESGATPEEIAHLMALYDGNLRYADHLVGQLLDWLDSTGQLSNTLVIVTSDHGEAFMQHGFLQHGTTSYEEMIHVPLILKFPESSGIATGHSSTPVELLDVFPTLASFYGWRGLPELNGRSLLPLIHGTAMSQDAPVFSFAPIGSTPSFAVRRGNEKYIANLDSSDGRRRASELYDLSADPGEAKNRLTAGETRSDYEALLVARFPKLLAATGRETQPADPQQVDQKTQDALEALGYIR
jgi:arylsulfatase A-like enzyme